MAHIEKRTRKDGSPAYHCEVNRQGFKRTKKVFDTKQAAVIWAAGIESAIEAGTRGTGDPRLTFNQLLELVEPRPGKSTYSAAVEYWRENLGHLRLSKITPVLIDWHRDALIGEPCSSWGHKTTRPRSDSSGNSIAVNFHKDKDALLKAGKVVISKPYAWISE